MKKFYAYLMSIIMIAGCALPAYAAEEDFVPSVTYKDAPGIISIGDEEGENGAKNIIGYVLDENGSVMSIEYDGCLWVVSLEEALDEESDISDAVRDLLLDTYNDFAEGETKLSDINEELNNRVADKFGKDTDADKLVIKDLFYLYAACEDLNEHLPPEKTTIDLTFDVDIPSGSFVQVLTYVNGEWKLVEKVVNNNENDNEEDDGTLTVTFEDLGLTIIVVPGTEEEPAGTFPWWIAALGTAVAGGTGFVYKRKKDKKD